jgi:hypothetical protein
MDTTLTQYTDEMLETWRTSRLGCLYMNSFLASQRGLEDESQLERVARVLAQRPLREKKSIQSTIVGEMNKAIGSEDRERAELYRAMLNHYIINTMSVGL